MGPVRIPSTAEGPRHGGGASVVGVSGPVGHHGRTLLGRRCTRPSAVPRGSPAAVPYRTSCLRAPSLLPYPPPHFLSPPRPCRLPSTPGMYLWLRLPPGVDDVAFCRTLVARYGVALSPGQGFGPGGRGRVRVALVRDEGVLVECAERIAKAMKEAAGEGKTVLVGRGEGGKGTEQGVGQGAEGPR